MDWSKIYSSVDNVVTETNSDTSTQKSTWQTISGWFGTNNGTDTSQMSENELRAEKETKVTGAKIESWIIGGKKIWNEFAGYFNGSAHRVKVTEARINTLQSALIKSNYSLSGINAFFKGHAKGSAYETVKGKGTEKLHEAILNEMQKGMVTEGYIYSEKTENVKRSKGDYEFTYMIWSKPTGVNKQAVINAYNSDNVFGSTMGIGVQEASMGSSGGAIAIGLGLLGFFLLKKK